MPVTTQQLLELVDDAHALRDLQAYFGPGLPAGEVPLFTGGRFEAVGGGGDHPRTENVISAEDLIAAAAQRPRPRRRRRSTTVVIRAATSTVAPASATARAATAPARRTARRFTRPRRRDRPGHGLPLPRAVAAPRVVSRRNRWRSRTRRVLAAASCWRGSRRELPGP
ncbi:MAG: DUF6308 family protein [Actinomycetales bacterium]